ncbi:MAG: amidinotransferase [Deltaproteobacteria bacterium]|nr:amidinotransferase [Deltaproteobacteria bacterium]
MPSTLGGHGWRGRAHSHAEELGSLWAACGVQSAVAPLREVLLAEPGPEQAMVDDPAAWLMFERPEPDRLAQQARDLAAAYTAQGVRVRWSRPSRPLPNHLFCCDLFFMTPEGAILARMASEQRAGEERGVAEALVAAGIPVLLAPRGRATFEGADAMWLDPRTVLIGAGRRTNAEAVAQIRPLLASMGISLRVADLGHGVQHLLGAVNPYDEGHAAVLSAHCGPSIREALRGWQLLELAPSEETEVRRAMNFVTLGPRRVLMPAGCPHARAQFEAAGMTVFEAEVSEYIRGGGAMGCATGVLWRG